MAEKPSPDSEGSESGSSSEENSDDEESKQSVRTRTTEPTIKGNLGTDPDVHGRKSDSGQSSSASESSAEEDSDSHESMQSPSLEDRSVQYDGSQEPTSSMKDTSQELDTTSQESNSSSEKEPSDDDIDQPSIVKAVEGQSVHRAGSEPRGTSSQGPEQCQSESGVSSQTTSVGNSIDQDTAGNSAQAESVRSPTGSVASDLSIQEESEVLVSPHGSDADNLLVDGTGITGPDTGVPGLATVSFAQAVMPCANFPDCATSIPMPFHLNLVRLEHITAKAAVSELDNPRYRFQPVSFTRGSDQRQQVAHDVDEYTDDIEAMQSFPEDSPRMIQVSPVRSAGLDSVQSLSRGDPISWLASSYPFAMKLMASWEYAEGQSLGSTMQGRLQPVSEFLKLRPDKVGVGFGSDQGMERKINRGTYSSNMEPEVPLCAEQQALVELIIAGHNVFVTGSAGCGKTTVVKRFVKLLRQHVVTRTRGNTPEEFQRSKQVDIIAPTGRAALAIDGKTVWTYAGWTPDTMKNSLGDLKALAYGKLISKRLRMTDVLVIDEISMISTHQLDRLNEIMKDVRKSRDAFGGAQIVVTGDLFQLCPVKPFIYCYYCGLPLRLDAAKNKSTCPSCSRTWEDSRKWAFLSAAWEACNFEYVNLTQIHRQDDTVFIGLLQKCRMGIPFSAADKHLLLNHETKIRNPVRLFSTNSEANKVNMTELARLRSRQLTFKCFDDFEFRSPHEPNLRYKSIRAQDNTLDALSEHQFERRLDMKKGMLVVLLINLDITRGLVNGSQGLVIDFMSSYLPLPPGTLEAEDNKRQLCIPNQTGEHETTKSQNIAAFIRSAPEQAWPVVVFHNGEKRTTFAECRVNEVGDRKPYSILSRTQLPLTAGWAMTIHKSQGMTLDRVIVNLSRAFAEGQMYVALLRARLLEGLKVEALGPDIECNEQVREFWVEHFGWP